MKIMAILFLLDCLFSAAHMVMGPDCYDSISDGCADASLLIVVSILLKMISAILIMMIVFKKGTRGRGAIVGSCYI